MLERGRLYWGRLPDDPKARPVLVVSPDHRNALAYDVVIVPATTRIRIGPWSVVLRKGEGGLLQPSVLKCEQPFTMRKTSIPPEPLGGHLTRQRMAEVAAAIIRALELSTMARGLD